MAKEDTQFKPGQSGNPGGRPKDRPLTDALRRALALEIADKRKGKTKADQIAVALVNKAAEGDVPAYREIADRVEGKVPQAQEISGADGGPIGPIEVTVTVVDANIPPQDA